MNKPHMYYWVKDELDREWRVLIQGEYEKFEDGNNIVSELEVTEYFLTEEGVREGNFFPESEVPDEIRAFTESLLDDVDTYKDIQREYEAEGQHIK